MVAEYLTLDEVAAELKVSIWTVRRWISKEGLPAVKLARTVRIDKAALDSWLATRRISGGSRGG